MIQQVGPTHPVWDILDGYGVRFDPVKHAAYVRVGVTTCTVPQPPTPHVEPEWKDAPAGRSKCPVLHEDHEQGKGHYA